VGLTFSPHKNAAVFGGDGPKRERSAVKEEEEYIYLCAELPNCQASKNRLIEISPPKFRTHFLSSHPIYTTTQISPLQP